MTTKINVQPLFEEFGNPIYIIKLLLKDVYNVPVIINPLDVHSTNIEVEIGKIDYKFEGTYFEYTYTD